MKKTIISLAVTAGMAASSAAFADATVYGNLHLSLDDADNGTIQRSADGFTTFDNDQNTDSIEMKSQTSAIGVKGSEDLGDGMKAFYKVEFQVDLSERNNGKDNSAGALTDRDQYIGLKGGMGTVKFGTVTSNYKAKGGSVDPMYRTSLEGRGALQMQSPLHGGAGRAGGRLTDAVQYHSPKMGGMQLVINTTFDGADTAGNVSVSGTKEDIDETIGVGFRYEAKNFTVFADYINVGFDDTEATDVNDVAGDEAATKIGGTFTAGPVKLGVQLEQTEDLIGADYMMISANYSIDKNNAIYVSFGQRDDYTDGGTSFSDTGSTSYAIMYNHNMSKKTNLYVGYGNRSDDDEVIIDDGADELRLDDYSVLTAGMRVKF